MVAYASSLLEAGPADRYPWIHIPIGYAKTMFHPVYNWGFKTESDPGMNGRQIYWPRGRTLGGSSAINGLIYIRGQREDYDHWAALGNAGWSYDDVLPYFRKLEHNVRGANRWHGARGRCGRPTSGQARADRGAHRGGVEIGIPRNDDFNGATQEGVGYYQLTTRRGLRCSTATAYLRPRALAANLAVETGRAGDPSVVRRTESDRRRLSPGRPRRSPRSASAKSFSPPARCSRRSFCSCPASASALLREFGIPVVHDLRGVGENLQDHLQARVISAAPNRSRRTTSCARRGASWQWASSTRSCARARWRSASTRAAFSRAPIAR
jgi:choline dehydrogenase